MKSSLRSATLFLSDSVPALLYRLASCGRVAPILLFLAVLLLPLTAEAGLPRVAISIPTDQHLAVGLKAAEQCNVPGKLIVLPPLSFDFAGDESSAELFAKSKPCRACPKDPRSGCMWWWTPVHLLARNPSRKLRERVDAL